MEGFGNMMKKNVIIRGPLLSISGYGTHSRQIFNWLESLDANISAHITPWGATPWYINSEKLNGLIGRIMVSSNLDSQLKADASFQIQLPNEWDPDLAKYNVGITAAVETDKCNPDWVAACNKMDKVVVPSLHTKKVLEASGDIKVEIIVIPESFYECMEDSSNEIKLDLDLKTDFNFLIFGQLTGSNPFSDRKNTFFALKWLFEEFAEDEDVGIVIKTNSGQNTTKDRKATFAMINQLVHEVRQGPYPKVYILHGALEPEEIQSVYQNEKIKGLVSATRGEGYGLPLLEAAACGLPVLATNWSGHLDFLKNGKFISFDYKLEPIHESRVDNSIFIPGTRWAEVDEKDYKRKVRKFYKASQKPNEWAEKLQGTIREKYSQKAISEIYSKLLGTWK